MTAIEAAGLWVAAHMFLMIYLSARVGMTRMKLKVNLGDGDNPTMIRAIRTHGNYIEYAPAALIGLLALSALGAAVAVVHVIGAAFFFARISHLLGLGLEVWKQGRMVGTMLTMITLLATGLALAYYALIV